MVIIRNRIQKTKLKSTWLTSSKILILRSTPYSSYLVSYIGKLVTKWSTCFTIHKVGVGIPGRYKQRKV